MKTLIKIWNIINYPVVTSLISIIPTSIFAVIKLIMNMELHLMPILFLLLLGVFISFAIFIFKKYKTLKDEQEILWILEEFRNQYTYGKLSIFGTNYNMVGNPEPYQRSSVELYKVEREYLQKYLLKRWGKTKLPSEIEDYLNIIYKHKLG